jgi:hypothetical protein
MDDCQVKQLRIPERFQHVLVSSIAVEFREAKGNSDISGKWREKQ